MKSLEELATLTTTNIADLVPKVILDEVEEAARARRFGRNLIRINDDLTRTKGRSIVVGRRGTVTAQDVNEGENLSGAAAQGITYTAHTITPTKKGVAVHITEEAIEGAELNLIKDSVTEAGIALADKEDLDIMKALLDVTVDKATFSGAETVSVAGGKLVYVDEDATNFDSADYFDGKIVSSGAATITYWQSGLGDVFVDSLGDGNTWDVDAYKSIASGVIKVKGRKWSPKFLIMHPDALGGVLRSTMFMDAAKYGSNEPIITGEIGKISGQKILVTTQMPAGAALVIDPNRAAWMAVRRNLDMKRWDNPQSDSIELYFFVEYGVQVTDEEALEVIVNITKGSVDL